MREYGLIGYPLTHSLSQKYFTQKFLQQGITDAVFEMFPIPHIAQLTDVLTAHAQLKGLAVTIPYKKSIISFLSQASDEVKKTGACNCVKISGKKLIGYNTDVTGFKKSFTKHLQPHHIKALILGTGGAAAAAEYVLQKLKMEYLFVSRQSFNQNNCIRYNDLNKKILSNYSVIINCTPLGAYPAIGEAPPIPYQFVTPQHYLFDMVYNPPETKFLLAGEKMGAITQNGYEMLVIQAEENWKIWNT